MSDAAQMDPKDWVRAYAVKLGVDPPTDEEFETILNLAGVAAHSSERIAAPVACWLAGRSGKPLAEVRALADEVA